VICTDFFRAQVVRRFAAWSYCRPSPNKQPFILIEYGVVYNGPRYTNNRGPVYISEYGFLLCAIEFGLVTTSKIVQAVGEMMARVALGIVAGSLLTELDNDRQQMKVVYVDSTSIMVEESVI